MTVGGMAWRVFWGLLLLIYLVLILFWVRDMRAGRPRAEMPKVLVLTGIMVSMVPQAFKLSVVAHRLIAATGVAFMVFGMWRHLRSRRTGRV
jgi:hypothetical protein